MKLINRWKSLFVRFLQGFAKSFVRFAEWAENQWVSLVVMMTLMLMFTVLLITLSWLIGYWSNGLFGTKFELQSCWAGIGAVGTGMLSVAGMAGAAWSKYYTDSKLNSEAGKSPSPFNKIKEMMK